MCVALVSISEIQDSSQALLATLGASLLSSFDPHEIVSDATMSACSSALLKITALARKGYLKGSPSTSKMLADVVSTFSVRSTAVATSRRLSTTTTYPVVTAVSHTLSIPADILIDIFSC
jgi:sensor histidine kinase YesM